MTKLLCKLCMGVANWPLWEIILYCHFTVGSGNMTVVRSWESTVSQSLKSITDMRMELRSQRNDRR